MRHTFRRIITLLLTAAMLTALCPPAALAAEGAKITVDAPNKLPEAGKTFSVSVSISENTGFGSVQFLLNYDRTVVQCTGVKTGEVLKGALSASNENAARGAMIAAASATELKGNGTLAEFSFKMRKDGDAGLWLSDVVIANTEGEPVLNTVTQAKIAKEPGTLTEPAAGSEEDPPRDRFSGDDPDTPLPGAAAQQSFYDVPVSFWAGSEIERAAELGLVAGFSDGTFKPNASVTRAQFVVMLWRMAGQPEAEAEAEFTDTVGGDWYRDALNWAVEHEYVTGVGDGKFNPGGSITRQQAMAILFRYSGGQSGMETMFTADYDAKFVDHGQIASWAKPAVYWAVFKGILTGATASTIAPNAPASRAQIAVILLRYMDKVTNKEETDV